MRHAHWQEVSTRGTSPHKHHSGSRCSPPCECRPGLYGSSCGVCTFALAGNSPPAARTVVPYRAPYSSRKHSPFRGACTNQATHPHSRAPFSPRTWSRRPQSPPARQKPGPARDLRTPSPGRYPPGDGAPPDDGFAATRAFVSASNRRSSMNASRQISIGGDKPSAPWPHLEQARSIGQARPGASATSCPSAGGGSASRSLRVMTRGAGASFLGC